MNEKTATKEWSIISLLLGVFFWASIGLFIYETSDITANNDTLALKAATIAAAFSFLFLISGLVTMVFANREKNSWIKITSRIVNGIGVVFIILFSIRLLTYY